MNPLTAIACLSALLSAGSSGLVIPGAGEADFALLDQEVPRYELTDGSLVDGLAELSRIRTLRLHLGIEEILRERLQGPSDRSVRFSLVLEHKSVRDILNTLCGWDARYTWSTDGASINVYPWARTYDRTDLLNFEIERIELRGIPDPYQALTPLVKLFPEEPIGYMQSGGDSSYQSPWTVTFEHLTVRQLANRIAEHMGQRTAWIWQGGKDCRMFTFLRGGFHTGSAE